AEIEAANPQFGPLSGRNFGLIYQGEKVTLPDRGAQDPLALVSRAPAGPPLPVLLQAPQEPSNPTDFQQAEYNRTVAANKATNDARIAAWRAEAERAVQPWQSQVTATLDAKAGTMTTGTATSRNQHGGRDGIDRKNRAAGATRDGRTGRAYRNDARFPGQAARRARLPGPEGGLAPPRVASGGADHAHAEGRGSRDRRRSHRALRRRVPAPQAQLRRRGAARHSAGPARHAA